MHINQLPVVCLTGPTAVGKSQLAIDLAQLLPCDIISVDSVMVYRGMDIGTAKPDTATLTSVPHRLVNIRDPIDFYSAGDFFRDALGFCSFQTPQRCRPLNVYRRPQTLRTKVTTGDLRAPRPTPRLTRYVLSVVCGLFKAKVTETRTEKTSPSIRFSHLF